jgi:uncharacterized LabA/DUF88 family protein
MKDSQNNVVYIDGANLHKGIENLGWKLDYKRLRVWLSEKYHVQHAYLFLGLVPKYKDMYTKLQEDGYTLIFKEVTYDNAGKVKGNCDADIVVRVMRDTYENTFEKAILVSSDGDYASLISFLIEKQKLEVILAPSNAKKCSVLLRRTAAKIVYLDDKKAILKK